jgi:4-phytase/acid phosphatase
MGASYRKGTLADLFRTSYPGECPEAFFWADRDERTLMTARALVGGLVGGPNTPWAACNLPVRETTEATDPPPIDPVFHPTRALSSKGCKPPAAENPPVSQGYVGLVQDVVKCCSENLCKQMDPPRTSCELKDLMADKKTQDKAYDFIQSFGEILLFEYAQRFEGNNFAFGNPQYPPTKNGKWMELLAIHADLFNKMQRNSSVALPQGANLLYHMAYAIKYGAPLIPPSTKGPPSKVVVYVGHDTNIANVAGLLGLEWKIGDYPPNDVAPGAALAFEVRLDPNHIEYVYAVMLAQPPESLRGDGSDVSSQLLRIPGCRPDGSCAMGHFVTIVKHAIKYDENRACITDWRDLAD